MHKVKRLGELAWKWAGEASGGISVVTMLLGQFNGWDEATVFRYTAYFALAICAVIATAKNWSLEERLKPKVTLQCDTNIPGCVVPNSMRDSSAVFYRLAITSDCDLALEGCQGRLIEIRRFGEPMPLWSGDYAILTFAPSEKGDSEARTIHPHVTVYLDVLMVALGPVGNFLGLFPGTKDRQWRFMPALRDIFNAYGRYVLCIQIVGDNMPTVTRYLEFTWRGHIDSEIKLIEE